MVSIGRVRCEYKHTHQYCADLLRDIDNIEASIFSGAPVSYGTSCVRKYTDELLQSEVAYSEDEDEEELEYTDVEEESGEEDEDEGSEDEDMEEDEGLEDDEDDASSLLSYEDGEGMEEDPGSSGESDEGADEEAEWSGFGGSPGGTEPAVETQVKPATEKPTAGMYTSL